MPYNVNAEQLEVINDWNNNILLTAIPGSGKTRTIVYKIIEKIKMNNKNKMIVAITYTNRAAEEMLERIYKEIGETDQIFIGTIHSFCYEFIFKKYHSKLKYFKTGYKIISPEYEQNLIFGISVKYNLSSDEKKLITYNKIKTTIKNDGTYIETNNNFIGILNDYYLYLKENSLLNFDLLLYSSFEILKKHNYIARNLKNAIECLYIDEYQDTTQLQYDILSCIYKSNNSKQQIMFVGDSNQAIYSSLGSITKSLQDLNSEFETNFIHRELNGCYRSYQPIIDYYRTFAVNDITMISKKDDDFKVNIQHYFFNEDNTYKKVVELIYDLLNNGVKESGICIMAPWWYLLLPISKKLKELMPTIKFDAPEISPIKRNEDLPIYKLSRLICMKVNHENINYKRRLVIDFRKKFKEFYNVTLDFIIDEFLTKIEKRRDKIKYSVGTEYLENELNYFIYDFFGIDENIIKTDLKTFLEEVNTRVNDTRYKIDNIAETFMGMFSRKDGIVISTCHGVKGEEYDAIICLFVNEGKIPHFSEKDNREIAKKLLFVMFSRAKKEIYVFPVLKDQRDMPTLELNTFFADLKK